MDLITIYREGALWVWKILGGTIAILMFYELLRMGKAFIFEEEYKECKLLTNTGMQFSENRIWKDIFAGWCVLFFVMFILGLIYGALWPISILLSFVVSILFGSRALVRRSREKKEKRNTYTTTGVDKELFTI